MRDIDHGLSLGYGELSLGPMYGTIHLVQEYFEIVSELQGGAFRCRPVRFALHLLLPITQIKKLEHPTTPPYTQGLGTS